MAGENDPLDGREESIDYAPDGDPITTPSDDISQIDEPSDPIPSNPPTITIGDASVEQSQIHYSDLFVMRCIIEKWRYNTEAKMWMHWNDRFWDFDTQWHIHDECRKFLGDQLHVFNDDTTLPQNRDTLRFILRTCARKGIVDITSTASADTRMTIHDSDLDSNPYVLNLLNGEFDLKTNTLHIHDPDHMHSKCCNVSYDPSAKCPEWETHISTVFNGDDGMIDSVQQLFGYCLFHGNPDSLFAIFNGAGRNGKSVTLDVVSYILGSYAVAVNPDCLMEEGGKAGSDRMKMKGARLIVASEPADDGRGRCTLDSGFIKSATGNDVLSSRKLYQESVEFRIGGLVVIVTNTLPFVRDQSLAMRERVWTVPFDHVFHKDERKRNIAEVLRSESSGILNWMIVGYKKYVSAGWLKPCQAVTNQTTKYLDDEDPYTQFFNDAGVVRGRGLTINAGELYKLYSDWCVSHLEHARSIVVFGRHMGQRFQKKHTMNGALYLDVGLGGQKSIESA